MMYMTFFFTFVYHVLTSFILYFTSTVVDLAAQHQEAVSLCSEVLNLLNNCNPQGATSRVVIETVTSWLLATPTSLLLLPVVTAAGRTLASVSHMARIVETGIDAHFSQGM